MTVVALIASRAIRTSRYTYVRDLQGPWLLFDNQADPHQMTNLVGQAGYAKLQAELDALLRRKLRETRDEFLRLAHGPSNPLR